MKIVGMKLPIKMLQNWKIDIDFSAKYVRLTSHAMFFLSLIFCKTFVVRRVYVCLLNRLKKYSNWSTQGYLKEQFQH